MYAIVELDKSITLSVRMDKVNFLDAIEVRRATHELTDALFKLSEIERMEVSNGIKG